MQWTLVLAPVILGVLTVTALIAVAVLRPNSNLLFALATTVSSLGFVIAGVLSLADKLTKDRANRQEYKVQLVDIETKLRDFRRQQQTSLRYLYPDMSQIAEWPQLPNPPRLWERRVDDQDFFKVRMGIGSRPSTVEVRLSPSEKKVPMLEEANRVANEYRQVSDVPDLAEIFEVGSMGIVGNPYQTSALVRAMMCHLSAHHSPEDVKIMATYSAERRDEWFWLGWLPHTLDDKGHPRLASHSDQLAEISNFMIEVMKRREIVRYNSGADQNSGIKKDFRTKKPFMFPCYLWVIEDFELVQDDPAIKRIFEVGADFGVFLLITTPNPAGVPERCRAVATIRPNGQVTYEVSGENGRKATLQPDMCDVNWAEQFALSMAPLQLKAASGRGELPINLRMLEMDDWNIKASLGEQFDPSVFWNRSSVGTLKAPIGRLFGGQPLYLDISDKGHGPHGIIAGTTGSGKSELLLTIVSALALANSPDNLNFILGDFKGGLAFNPFKTLPHVVGMMSNLDLTIVERAMTALFSELQYRQRLLDKEGVAHIRDYQRKKPRAEVPMPYLLVIIDEFAEMKEQAPDFMEKIVNIARLGRTLGVHMVLATQRPAGVVSGQLNSNTNFRLCLRVVAPEDSADMLGRKDAFLIPSNRPGRCFIKVGSDIFEQFQVARVAIPFGPNLAESEADKPVVSVIDRHWSAAPLVAQAPGSGKKKASEEQEILPMDYDVINDLCVKAAARMTLRNKHRPWLDPMGSEYFLPDFLEGKAFDVKRMTWPKEPPFGYGIVPIAFLDDVVKQEQRTFYINLLEEGSYCISGLAQSGKTNVLRTMVTSLALTHAPDDMSFYILDMGGTLRPFAQLPHKTTYVGMAAATSLKGIVKELYEELQNRRQLFAEKGVLDITSFRTVTGPGERVPSIFIAFDNYATIRHNPSYDNEQLKALVREGRSYGMHVAITMDRGADFEFGRMAGQFLQISLRQAREDILFTVPKNMIGSWNGIPGRCFIKGDHNKPPLELQVLLPCKVEIDEQTRALEDLVIDTLKPAAMANPAWARLNIPPEEKAPVEPPKPVLASLPVPVIAARPAPAATDQAVVGPNAVVEKQPLAESWDELFAIDEPASIGGEEDQGAVAAPAKTNLAAAWDDLFAIDEPAIVAEPDEVPGLLAALTGQPGQHSVPASTRQAQPDTNAQSAPGTPHPPLKSPPPPAANVSPTGEIWNDFFKVDEPASYVAEETNGGNNRKGAPQKSDKQLRN